MFKKSNLIKLSVGCILIVAVSRLNISTVVESTSKNNENSIEVISRGSFLFGANRISISADMKGIKNIFKGETYKTEIRNDGKSISEKNVNIQWVDDYNAIIILMGEEQSQECVEISFGDNITVK